MSAPPSSERANLLGFDQAGLQAWLAEWGEPAFRARQLMGWVYRRGVGDISAMTDLAKSLRQRLEEEACIDTPRVLREEHAADDTRKWLLQTGSGTGGTQLPSRTSARGRYKRIA